MTGNSLWAIATTYFPPGPDGDTRVAVAREALTSWTERLTPATNVLVVDDASAETDSGINRARDLYDRLAVNRVRLITHSHPGGVGKSLNLGIEYLRDVAFPQHAGAFLYAVDDWAATADLDLTPLIDALEHDPSLGAIRLGPPHPGLRGTVVPLSARAFEWALDLDPYGVVLSQRPTLFHTRLFDALGTWPEDVSAVECERLMNERWARARSEKPHTPRILLALPTAWRHLASVELAHVEPAERRAEHGRLSHLHD